MHVCKSNEKKKILSYYDILANVCPPVLLFDRRFRRIKNIDSTQLRSKNFQVSILIRSAAIYVLAYKNIYSPVKCFGVLLVRRVDLAQKYASIVAVFAFKVTFIGNIFQLEPGRLTAHFTRKESACQSPRFACLYES